MIHLTSWATGRPKFTSPYLAPEVAGICLRGIVTGHPHKPDGSQIITSRIVLVRGREVKTESGSWYRLGEPSAEFLEHLKNEGRVFDPEAPIKVVGK
jgi:hypothetical protein